MSKRLHDIAATSLIYRSTDHSLRTRRWQVAIYWILLAVGTHLPELNIGQDANPFGVFQVDKALHVIGFAGLTWLIARARFAGTRVSSFTNALVAMCIAGSYALIDEYTQRWTGRVVALSDIVAGLIGIVGVFIILTAPPPYEDPDRSTLTIRLITALLAAVILVLALLPAGNRWISWITQPLGLGPHFDKTGHFYAAVILTLLLLLSQPAGVHRPRLGIALSILAVGLAGPIIETAQSYTGRGVEVADMYAHQLGLLAAISALAVITIGRALRWRITSGPIGT